MCSNNTDTLSVRLAVEFYFTGGSSLFYTTTAMVTRAGPDATHATDLYTFAYHNNKQNSSEDAVLPIPLKTQPLTVYSGGSKRGDTCSHLPPPAKIISDIYF